VNTDKKNIDGLLHERFVPSPSHNLAQRIIAASAQNPKRSFLSILMTELSEMFVIPRPAYAIAGCVLLGLVMGLQMPVDIAASDTNYFSFLTIDEEGWLYL